MEVAVFQKKLAELCEIAEENDHRLTTEQVRSCFEESDLDVDQLLRVVQYLKGKGIEILGAASTEAASQENIPEQFIGTSVELSAEDRAYLEEYLEAYDEAVYGEAAWEELLERWTAGDDMAKAALLQYYLPKTARIAAEHNCEEIALPDLIQEANIALLMALDGFAMAEEGVVLDDAWIRAQVLNGIREAVEEQSEQRMHDNALVSRVEKLESAVKDLTDEEDGELKFSVDELAVILDMKAEEIRDILKLTGDDK